jgi:hypothetical protein
MFAETAFLLEQYNRSGGCKFTGDGQANDASADDDGIGGFPWLHSV